MATFGETIAEHRRRLDLSQRELAARVIKEDGESISPQYLNDLEHNRRNPPGSFLIEQFAKALSVRPEVLYFCAGELTPDLTCAEADDEQVVAAYRAFRQTLHKEREKEQ